MNKVLIIVYVPYIEKTYEVFVPISKRIHTIVALLTKAINELTAEEFKIKSDYILYDKRTGKIYDFNITVKESELRNGSEVILI